VTAGLSHPAERAGVAPVEAAQAEGVRLLVPAKDVADPEVSIVVPALNEELTIEEFVAWCHEGLRRAGVVGEILIVDSSNDSTADLALAAGARVLKTPKRGLGRAYIDAIPFIRGSYVIMGDADCTYDFRELGPFVEKLRVGYEFVMGSRWRGSIEPGAMPFLHRYLGTPLTTRILNVLYSSHFSDIHCGMRAISRDALERMRIGSQSWEYASEMVLKSIRMQLRTSEVPVHFLKDRNGRVSHHRRAGWFSPWQAAWINLRAMFTYGADFFVLWPGLTLFALGLLLTLPLSGGPITLGPITFSLYWMLAGLTLATLGLQCFYFGCIAQVLYDYTGTARKRWLRLFSYDRTVLAAATAAALGVGLTLPLIVTYFERGLSLPTRVTAIHHLAVTGVLLVIIGFTTFTFTLLLNAAAALRGEKEGADGSRAA
jgi:glycosyltransferase involved in cell wall biosynthesis